MGLRKITQTLSLAMVFGLSSVVHGKALLHHWEESGMELYLSVIMFCMSALSCLVCIDIWRLNPADSHSLTSLVQQYCSILYLRLKAPYLRWWVEKTTKDPRTVNNTSLQYIIKKNRNTTYGQEHRFSEMKMRDDFVRLHPITKPEDYQGYMNRLMHGEENVLYPPGETHTVASTSGTTGTAKVYAFTKEHVWWCRYKVGQLFPAVSLLPLLNLQRMAKFHIFSPVLKTEGGDPIGAGSQILFIFPPFNLVPQAYSKLFSEDASYYAQALFSLAEPELGYISGFSADLMYSYWKFMVCNWERLCTDIESGYIAEQHVDMPEDVRCELSELLMPDPARAQQLRESLKPGIKGLAKRVWPGMSFVVMGKSAAFKMCTDLLMENQLEGVKIIGFLHGATEGFTGLNYESKNPEKGEVETLTPFPCFTEFIPIEEVDEDSPNTVFPEDLKLNHLYEVVHTNLNGLYRCRYGDIIKIVGFYNNTPKYEFQYKLGQRLNIAYERTPDRFLYDTIKECQHLLPPGITVVNYTTTESICLEKVQGPLGKGHYIYFIEFNNDKRVDLGTMEKEMDDYLYKLYQPYKRFKDCGSIGDLRIIQVKEETFEGVKAYIWDDSPHGQFKLPRVLRRNPALRYLLNQRVRQ